VSRSPLSQLGSFVHTHPCHQEFQPNLCSLHVPTVSRREHHVTVFQCECDPPLARECAPIVAAMRCQRAHPPALLILSRLHVLSARGRGRSPGDHAAEGLSLSFGLNLLSVYCDGWGPLCSKHGRVGYMARAGEAQDANIQCGDPGCSSLAAGRGGCARAHGAVVDPRHAPSCGPRELPGTCRHAAATGAPCRAVSSWDAVAGRAARGTAPAPNAVVAHAKSAVPSELPAWSCMHDR
jgi:hypothetical protein